MDFLRVKDKVFVVFGVANKKSVAWHIAKNLEDNGARVVYIVRSQARKESTAKLLKDRQVMVCDLSLIHI